MPTIILKASEACNSHCKYCEVVARKAPIKMSFELLQILFKRIEEYLTEFPGEKITIIWHGGEPLLMGVSFFRRVNRLIETKYLSIRSKIEHRIQSNLTLLDESLLKELKTLGITSFGTSYDPIDNIRGGGALKDTAGYNTKFIKGITLLEEQHVSWGFIYVVTRESLGKAREILNFCTNFNLKNNFNIHPVITPDEAKNPLSITAGEYGHFLGEIFSYWWSTRHRYPDVQPFATFVNIYTHDQRPTGCETSGHCSHSHIYIGPDGETSHCGKLNDNPALFFGNIRNYTLAYLWRHPSREILANRVRKISQNDCYDCRFWDICHGGCPADSYIKSGSMDSKTFFCESLKIFLEQYFEPITGLKRDFYQNKKKHQNSFQLAV